MKIAVLITRTLLGLIFFVFGLNFFIHFMPMGGNPTGKAGTFMAGLMAAGYFMPLLKVAETLCGLFLLVNKYTAFFLVVLFPITLNIFLFDTILAPSGMPIGVLVIVLNLFLAYAYRRYYTSVFTTTPTV